MNCDICEKEIDKISKFEIDDLVLCKECYDEYKKCSEELSAEDFVNEI